MDLNSRWHAAGNLVVAALLLLAGWNRVEAAADKRQSKKVPPGFSVGNELGKEITISGEVWNKLPRYKVTVKGRDGAKVEYQGVTMVDLLRRAGVPFGKHLRGPRVSNYVLIEAADGYRAVFALAEVDPSITDNVILVADRKNGKLLPSGEGPYRVIAVQDKIHSRWVKQITKINVRTPKK